jgi:hypothetical protein
MVEVLLQIPEAAANVEDRLIAQIDRREGTLEIVSCVSRPGYSSSRRSVERVSRVSEDLSTKARSHAPKRAGDRQARHTRCQSSGMAQAIGS